MVVTYQASRESGEEEEAVDPVKEVVAEAYNRMQHMLVPLPQLFEGFSYLR